MTVASLMGLDESLQATVGWLLVASLMGLEESLQATVGWLLHAKLWTVRWPIQLSKRGRIPHVGPNLLVLLQIGKL